MEKRRADVVFFCLFIRPMFCHKPKQTKHCYKSYSCSTFPNVEASNEGTIIRRKEEAEEIATYDQVTDQE